MSKAWRLFFYCSECPRWLLHKFLASWFIRTAEQQGACYSLVSAHPFVPALLQRLELVVEGPGGQSLSHGSGTLWVPCCWQSLLLVPCLCWGSWCAAHIFWPGFSPGTFLLWRMGRGVWGKQVGKGFVFHLLCPPWYWWGRLVSLSVPAWKGCLKWLILYVQSYDLRIDCLKIWKCDRKPHLKCAWSSPPARVPSDSAC